MPNVLAGVICAAGVLYLLVGLYFAQRETGHLPASTRSQRRHRDEEFFTILVAWPRAWWDDFVGWFGW